MNEKTEPVKTFEELVKLVNEMNHYVTTTTQQGIDYEHWSNGFSLIQIRDNLTKYKKRLIEISKELDWDNVTENQLNNLNFCRWGSSPSLIGDERILMLVPNYLYDILPDGIPLYSILNKRYLKGIDEIDKDTRLGLYAFGIAAIKE